MTGANLWISGRNEEKLKDTAEEAKALGAAEVIILKVCQIHLLSHRLPSGRWKARTKEVCTG